MPKLRAVTAQARALEARVTLLHVIDTPQRQPEASSREPEMAASSFLEGVAAEMRRGGVEAEAQVRYGSIVPAVCEAAREVEAAMIVVGASEPKGLRRVVARVPRGAGLAGEISREAACPVLVVPRLAIDDEAA